MRTFSSKMLRATAVAVGLAGFAGVAHGSLVVSLVPVSGTPGQVVVSPSAVSVSNAGNQITFNVVATITGGNLAQDEGLQTVYGVLTNTVTGSGSATGSFGPFTPLSAFNNTGQPGATQANGDRGTTAASDFSTLPEARSGINPYNDTTGDPNFHTPDSVNGDVLTYVLGSVVWTVGATPQLGTTQLAWVAKPTSGFSASAVWFEDGVKKNNLSPNAAGYANGGPITITATPEPGSLALAGLGGMGMLLRRRRNK